MMNRQGYSLQHHLSIHNKDYEMYIITIKSKTSTEIENIISKKNL